MVVSRFCAYVFLICSIVGAGLFPEESDNEIVQVSLGEADGIENVPAAAPEHCIPPASQDRA